MKFYHVTHKNNIGGIISDGIDPRFSTGKMRASWFVSSSRIQWAIAHVSYRHNCDVKDIVVFEIWIDRKQVRRAKLSGVYNCFKVRRPTTYKSASDYLNLEID